MGDRDKFDRLCRPGSAQQSADRAGGYHRDDDADEEIDRRGEQRARLTRPPDVVNVAWIGHISGRPTAHASGTIASVDRPPGNLSDSRTIV